MVVAAGKSKVKGPASGKGLLAVLSPGEGQRDGGETEQKKDKPIPRQLR